MQGFQLIMNFLVMPIFFLSGALFPLDNLPAVADRGHAPRPAVVRRGRPARRAHRSRADRDRCIDSLVLLVVAGLFLVLGARAFANIQV